MGRSSSCAITFDEPSVSREHAHIYREGDQFYVLDKSSANGTFVNRERVGRRRLASRDEVGFGNARFRFIGPGEIYNSDEEPDDDDFSPSVSTRVADDGNPVTSYVLLSVVILLAAAVLSLGIVYVRQAHKGPERPTAAQYFIAGMNAMQARQWQAAQAQFGEFLTLEPSNHVGQRYLEKSERERSFEKQLAAARNAFGRGELLFAYTQAAAITDSVYTDEARELGRAIDTELDSRMTRAKVAIDAGQPKDAIDLLTAVDAVRPGRPDVTNLLDRARKAAQKPVNHPTPNPINAAAADEAVRLFAAGQIDAALAKAEAAGGSRAATMLRDNIAKFKQVFADAEVEYRAKRADPAIQLLEQAKALEQKITSPLSSSVQADVRRKLADMYYVRGIDALLSEHYTEALASLQAALNNDPGHVQSRRKLDELRLRANDFFSEAENLRKSDPDKAKARYRLLLQLIPSGDERYLKAKQRLDAMP